MDTSLIIKKPHITEKATTLAENNAYVFEVAHTANKSEIIKTLKKMYNVVPRKVNIVNISGKRTFVRGVAGKSTGIKKAMVYLKKGDTINLA